MERIMHTIHVYNNIDTDPNNEKALHVYYRLLALLASKFHYYFLFICF